MRTVTSRWFISIGTAVVVFGSAVWASHPYAVGVFHDDGVYAVLAKSLATGQGYRYLHLPGAPAATHYPPGYPLVLSLLWRIAPSFPGNTALFQLANAALLACTACALDWFARRVLGWSAVTAAVVALVATLSYPLIMLSGLVLSEPLFVALMFPALVAAERFTRDDADWRHAAAMGAAIGAIALVRTHGGGALFVATLAVCAYRRRWRAAAWCAAGAAIVVAPWQLWAMAHRGELPSTLQGSYGSYGGWLAQGARAEGAVLFAHTIAVNFRELGALLADRFALYDSAGVRLLSACIVGVVLVAGIVRLVRRAPVTAAFAVVYVAVMLVWPYTPWRFVFAIWPIVIIALTEGVRGAFVRGTPRRWLDAAALVVLAAGALREETRAYRRRAWTQPAAVATAQIAPLIRWVSDHTSPTDVVAAEGEQLVYLFTGRRAVPAAPFTATEYVQAPTLAQNAAALARIVDQSPVSYVVTISPPLIDAANLLVSRDSTEEGSAARLAPVGALSNGAGRAYRVERAAPQR